MFRRERVALRTPEQIEQLRRAGAVVAAMHREIRAAIEPGVTTLELDRIGREVLAAHGATSNFLGYHGYPAVICASPNEVVVHGIPTDEPLGDGDIVSIDCGAVVDGWHGDAAFTAPVGTIDAASQRLVDVGRDALDAAIEVMVPGNTIGDIGHAVQRVAEDAGFVVAADYTGHGIGRAMHESPSVPNTGRPGKGLELRAGMVLAVEPMLCAGSPQSRDLADGWTAVTVDGARAVHWEHSIAITDRGPDVLTR